MEGWLTFWLTPTGALTLVAALVGYLAWAYNYFKGELKDDPTYRKTTAAALTSHALLAAYRDRLARALDFLDRWMGAPGSFQALGVCTTMALVYALVFFVGSWTLGGPGAVGATELLPRLVWWQQVVAGVVALAYGIGFGWVLYHNERIDRILETTLARYLRPRFGDRAKRTAAWLYRLGGALTAASILLAAAIFWGSP